MNVVVPNRVRRAVPTGGRFARPDHAPPAALDLAEFPYDIAPTGTRIRDLDLPPGAAITMTTSSPLFTGIDLGRTAQSEKKDHFYAVAYVKVDFRSGLCPGQPAGQADTHLDEHRAKIHAHLLSRYGASLEGSFSWERTDAAVETYLYPDDREDEIVDLLELQTRATALYRDAASGQLYRDLAAQLTRPQLCPYDGRIPISTPVPALRSVPALSAQHQQPTTKESSHDRPQRTDQRVGRPGRPGPQRLAS